MTLVQVRLSPFSSRPSPVQRDEADLRMNLDRLRQTDLDRLHEVHFAVKFSEAEAQPRLRRT